MTEPSAPSSVRQHLLVARAFPIAGEWRMRFILRFEDGRSLRDLNERLESMGKSVFKRTGRGFASKSVWKHGKRGSMVLENVGYGCNAQFRGVRRLELIGSFASWIATHAADLVRSVDIEFHESDRRRAAARHVR